MLLDNEANKLYIYLSTRVTRYIYRGVGEIHLIKTYLIQFMYTVCQASIYTYIVKYVGPLVHVYDCIRP